MSLLMDMLDEIRKNFDLSILMTTHDFTMLEQYCDQVVSAFSVAEVSAARIAANSARTVASCGTGGV